MGTCRVLPGSRKRNSSGYFSDFGDTDRIRHVPCRGHRKTTQQPVLCPALYPHHRSITIVHDIVYTFFSSPIHQSLITSVSSGPSKYLTNERIRSPVPGRCNACFKCNGFRETVRSVRRRSLDRLEQVQDEGGYEE